ncbi:MAG: hypothetical protein FWD29_04300, partial [Micrococcales bacterium]|nr:hypothetical protein [Micrococcales bacterium]
NLAELEPGDRGGVMPKLGLAVMGLMRGEARGTGSGRIVGGVRRGGLGGIVPKLGLTVMEPGDRGGVMPKLGLAVMGLMRGEARGTGSGRTSGGVSGGMMPKLNLAEKELGGRGGMMPKLNLAEMGPGGLGGVMPKLGLAVMELASGVSGLMTDRARCGPTTGWRRGLCPSCQRTSRRGSCQSRWPGD